MRRSLIARLRERGVLRVAASYALIAWLVLQIADVVLQPWDLPGWVRRAPLVIAVLGFPIAIALAWFFELSDGAVARDAAPDGVVRPVAHGWRRHADILIISALAAAVGFFVLRDAGWLGEASRPGTRIESSSLAVLPFANVGAYAEQHVSDGLSDELRSQFSRMQSLRVTARSSSIAFRDEALDAVTIAKKLAVAALLEGTVGRGGGRLQVSVQLIDGKSGKVLWADRYDRPDKDLLAVQGEIANAVVAAVLPRFAVSGQAAPPPPTEDPVAYDLYLLGRQKLREADDLQMSADYSGAHTALAQAADLFRSAIRSDPKFAQAHASLAGVLLWQALGEIDEATNAEQVAAFDRQVAPEIERALALDPKNADAYVVKGRLLKYTHRPGVEAAFRRAVELDPSHALATSLLGWQAIAHGRVDERHRLVMRGLALDPMDLGLYGGAIMSAWILGRDAEVRAIVDRMQRLFPDNPGAVATACHAWRYLGRPDETLACVTQMRSRFAISGGDLEPELDVEEATAWEVLGDQARALRFYDRAAPRDPLAAREAMRLRRDIAGLRTLAEETLARRVSLFDWFIADAAAQVGLNAEAIEIHRRGGMAEVMGSDESFKPMVVHGAIQLVALLREAGEEEEARRLLDQVTEFNEAQRRHGGRVSGIHLAAAEVYALGGRIDEAFEQFALAVDAHDSPSEWPTIERAYAEPALAPLRDDPRFEVQMDRLRQRQSQLRAQLPDTFRRHGLTWPPK